jgi:hypothetical protein
MVTYSCSSCIRNLTLSSTLRSEPTASKSVHIPFEITIPRRRTDSQRRPSRRQIRNLFSMIIRSLFPQKDETKRTKDAADTADKNMSLSRAKSPT